MLIHLRAADGITKINQEFSIEAAVEGIIYAVQSVADAGRKLAIAL